MRGRPWGRAGDISDVPLGPDAGVTGTPREETPRPGNTWQRARPHTLHNLAYGGLVSEDWYRLDVVRGVRSSKRAGAARLPRLSRPQKGHGPADCGRFVCQETHT